MIRGGSGAFATPIAGGGGMTVGDAVTGGTTDTVLFVDGSGNLGSGSSFTWDSVTGKAKLQCQTTGTGAGSLVVVDSSNKTIIKSNDGTDPRFVIGDDSGANIIEFEIAVDGFSIGYNNARTNNNITIGNDSTGGNGASNGVQIGHNINGGGVSNVIVGGNVGGSTVGRSTAVGIGTICGNAQNYQCAVGHLVQTAATGASSFGTATSAYSNAISNSMAFVTGGTNPSMFLSLNSNLVLNSNAAVTAGTHYEAAAKNCITVHNGTAPTTGVVDAMVLYSVNLSAGNTMLGIYTEGTPVGSGTPSQDRTVAVEINGTTLYLLAATAAS